MWTNLLCISHNHILVHLSCHSITKTKQGPFTRLWWLIRESSLQETLARVYMYRTAGAPPPAPPVCARARPDGPASDSATLRPSLRHLRASASLRQKPRLYLAVNLEQLQQTAVTGTSTSTRRWWEKCSRPPTSGVSGLAFTR
jgi:hypothetical protein